jgi:hypothetical protein
MGFTRYFFPADSASHKLNSHDFSLGQGFPVPTKNRQVKPAGFAFP